MPAPSPAIAIDQALVFQCLDAIPIPLLVAEADDLATQEPPACRLLYLNQTFVTQIGYTQAEIPDLHSWLLLAYPDAHYRHHLWHQWQQTLLQAREQSLRTAEMSALVRCKNGQRRWFLISTKLQPDFLNNWHIVTLRDVHDLHCMVEENRRLSHTDPLTQLLNRREMQHQLEGAWHDYQQHRQPFSLLMCDVDHFKQVNDQHGHACGDQVLCQLAELLRQVSRRIDCVARWGGEEFLLLLPNTEAAIAGCVAERIRHATEQMRHYWDSRPLSITTSIGCATMAYGHTIPELLSAADAALYRAKTAGRNRVCQAPQAEPAAPQEP